MQPIVRWAVLSTLALKAFCADPTLPVPANLTAESIPGIPGALMERLAAYNEYRTAALLDWHPTRREILISTRFGQTPQIHRVTHPGGARTQLTFFNERASASARSGLRRIISSTVLSGY